jgi:hypothetical protein
MFENEFIFCMFTSMTGCKISLTIEFPNEDGGRHRKKETEEDPKTDKEKYEAKLAKRVVQKVIKPRQDKIEDNIKKISMINRNVAQERKTKSQVFKRRRDDALKKRDQLFMEKIRINVYYMNRWDIVREKQKDIEKAERHQERRELFKFWYVRQQRTIVALKSVFEVFDKTRTAILNKYKEKLLAKRIVRKFNKFSEK